MKNWQILLPIALLLCGLGAWAYSSLGDSRGGPGEVVETGGAGAAGPEDGGPSVPGTPASAGKSQAGPGAPKRLTTGPTWNPRNPWFETRGIGRTTQPPSEGAVLFPDGTWLPVLNGVENAPPYPGFNRGYPYAPVTQIVTDDKGTQWYVHADGSRSSPQNMKYGEGGNDLGTRSGWAIGNPLDKKPVVGPDGKIRYEPQKTPQPAIRKGPGG